MSDVQQGGPEAPRRGLAAAIGRHREVVAAVIIVLVALTPMILDETATPVGGDIFIHGPQIYTRERLVNDRYQEDSWLNTMLEDSAKVSFGYSQTLQTSAKEKASLGITGGSAGSSGQSSQTSSSGTSQQQGGRTDQDANNGKNTLPDVQVPPTYQLQARHAYRERIRSMLVENQLDDRHDLHGNTLYRLHFDATILPNEGSRAAARIEISFNRPPDLLHLPKDIKGISYQEVSKILVTWEHLYTRWLNSIEVRLNEAATARARRYETGKFGPDDYDILLARLRSTVIDVSQKIRTPLPIDATPTCKERQAAAIERLEAVHKAADVSPDLSDLWSKAESEKIDTFRDLYARGLNVDEESEIHKTYRKKIQTLIKLRRSVSPLLSAASCATEGLIDFNPVIQPATEVTDREELRQLIYAEFWAKIYAAVTGVDDVESADLHRDQATPFNDMAPKSMSSYAIIAPRPLELNAPFQVSPRTLDLKFSLNEKCIRDVAPKGNVFSAVKGQPLPDYVTAIVTAKDKKQLFTGTPEYAAAARYAPELLPNVVAQVGEILGGAAANESESCYANGLTVAMPMGLFNFVGRLRKATTIYTYAINPSEPDELIGNRARSELAREFDAGMALKALSQGMPSADVLVALKKDMVSDLRRDTVRRPVYGYGKDGTIESQGAMLGWQVMPLDFDSTASKRSHLEPKQIPMTALVSLPAWWDRVEFEVKRVWVDRQGREVAIKDRSGETPRFAVEFPTNFETLDALLFDAADSGPVVVDWQIPQLLARPCARFSVTIIGRRLWRSTVVTLGSVRANRVTVMPNMNGIIAEFAELPIPPGAATKTARPYFAPLTVWTSQGQATLPKLIEYASLERVPENLRCPASPPN